MLRSALLTFALAAAAAAAPTRIVGTLRNATGETLNGMLFISWQTFTGADSTIYPGRTMPLNIKAGRFDATLQPGAYFLTWGSIGNKEYRTLTVPTSSATVALAACLTTTPPPAALQLPLLQLSPSGAITGQVITYNGNLWAPASTAHNHPISAVDGLQTALDAKASAPYTATFTSQTQLTITAATHGLTSAAIAVQCYDTSTPAKVVEGDVTVNAGTRAVVIAFAEAQSGSCILR
jgi:hypothetical protein